MTNIPELTAIVATFIFSAGSTAIVRFLARRWGVVARPKADRWHTKPTALMGGVSIAVATIVSALTFVPQTHLTLTVLGASLLMFVIGIVDDLVSLKPYQKVIGQLIAASIVVGADMILPWTGYYPVNVLITMFWLVGITNAVNLLDNMDGLAAGVSAVAAVFLGLQFAQHPDIGTDYALMLALFTASLLGFLVFNHNPASIFMGDCGSLFIGFFLASSALLTNQASRSRSFLPVLAVPVLVLFIPIFDTTLVFILRKMAGRSVSQGGRDHTSHRLVALGLSERKAVWMLWALAAVSGLVGLAILKLPAEAGFATLFCFCLTLIYLGIHLGKVKVYDVSQPTPVMSFIVDVSHKRRIFEVLLDSSLVVFSYYLAFTLVLGPLEGDAAQADTFFRTLPLVVGLKLTAFTAAGVYRGMWRYITPDALWLYFRGSLLGSMSAVVVLTLVFRFQGFSRAVFALDGFLLLFLMIVSRFGFRLMRKVFPQSAMQRESRPVLIYGAGDAGEILARELINNPRWRLRPVGFLDDDPQKSGRTLHGLRVYGGLKVLKDLRAAHDIAGVILSSRRFAPERLEQIRDVCKVADLEMYQLALTIMPILNHEDIEEPLSQDTFDDMPATAASQQPPVLDEASLENVGNPSHAGT